MEFLKSSPLPHLYIFDILRSRRKLHEAVNELEKAVPQTITSGMYGEFTERLRSIVSLAADDPVLLEPCGFMWLAVGMPEEGLPILDRVAEEESASADAGRSAMVREVLDAIRGGWDVASSGALSFQEAAEKRARSEAPSGGTPMPPPAEPKGVPPGAAEEGYEREESIVRSALGRLQLKVEEEIGDKDPEARYNLGIAYKEMGLLDEAVTEFRLAMRKPELLVGAGSLLADTLVDRADMDGAIAVLDEILSGSAQGEAARRDVRYHKAVLLAQGGRQDEAREIFREIREEAPGYRDVEARLRGPEA